MFLAHARLKRTTDNALVFDESLNYQQCLAIVDSLYDGEALGVQIEIDPSYERFILDSQTYIEQRSQVGLAIKARDKALESEFGQFCSVVNESMTRPLRDKQLRDAFFMASVRWSANFSVPGSGKTAAVLGAFAFLRYAGKVSRIIVVCPKSAFDSWRTEWNACFGHKLPMHCFCLASPEVQRLSKEQRKRSIIFDSGAYNLMLFNYEALGSYTDELREIVGTKTLLVFDEVHRVKRIGGAYAQWALDVSEPAKYTAVLTGTPIPNTYQDIYNFLHILYPDDYDTFFGFQPGLLRNPGMADIKRINDALRPFFCRTNKDELGVPKPEPDEVHVLEPTTAENEFFNILTAAYAKNHLVFLIRALQLESNPQMLKEAIDPQDFEYVLDQVGEDPTDIDFVDYSDEVAELIEECETTTKTRACEELVYSLALQGKPVIVWCIFVRSITTIANDLNKLGISARAIYGATPLEEREEILDGFRDGLFQVLVTNPHTLAESVSLHQMCHDAVYFEYSYNLVHLLQSKDRIHRLGLPKDQYTQYHFLQVEFQTSNGYFSLDGKIYNRLLEKEQTMLEAIDGGYLEGGYLDEEDIEIVLGDLFGTVS